MYFGLLNSCSFVLYIHYFSINEMFYSAYYFEFFQRKNPSRYTSILAWKILSKIIYVWTKPDQVRAMFITQLLFTTCNVSWVVFIETLCIAEFDLSEVDCYFA